MGVAPQSCQRPSRLSIAQRVRREPPTRTAKGRDTKPLLVSVQFCAPLSVRTVTAQSDLNCLNHGNQGVIFHTTPQPFTHPPVPPTEAVP
jgi:hypothetical protein